MRDIDANHERRLLNEVLLRHAVRDHARVDPAQLHVDLQHNIGTRGRARALCGLQEDALRHHTEGHVGALFHRA